MEISGTQASNGCINFILFGVHAKYVMSPSGVVGLESTLCLTLPLFTIFNQPFNFFLLRASSYLHLTIQNMYFLKSFMKNVVISL